MIVRHSFLLGYYILCTTKPVSSFPKPAMGEASPKSCGSGASHKHQPFQTASPGISFVNKGVVHIYAAWLNMTTVIAIIFAVIAASSCVSVCVTAALICAYPWIPCRTILQSYPFLLQFIYFFLFESNGSLRNEFSHNGL